MKPFPLSMAVVLMADAAFGQLPTEARQAAAELEPVTHVWRNVTIPADEPPPPPPASPDEYEIDRDMEYGLDEADLPAFRNAGMQDLDE